MGKVIPSIVLTLLLGMAAQIAYGCSCDGDYVMKKPNYKKWLKEFDGAAFKGRVVSIEEDKEKFELKVTFAVDSYWRGVDGPEFIIYTAIQSPMCGVFYEIGEERTVFAARGKNNFQVGTCSEMHYMTHLKGYLKALGKAKKPPKPAPVETQTDDARSRFLDEIVGGNCEDELARLDMLANELQSSRGSIAYLIAYGGKEGKKDAAKARLARMSYYLSSIRGTPKPILIDGGYRNSATVAFWLYYPGEFLPMPSPSVDAKEVKLSGSEKIRGYNCADEMGDQESASLTRQFQAPPLLSIL